MPLNDLTMNSNLDEQFDLKRRHPLGRFYKYLNSLQSSFSRRAMKCAVDIPYGETEGQKLDIFPAKNNPSPVFVFVHGGYFRSLDKRQYSFIAPTMYKLGYTTVVINYDLAPKVKVAEIIRQCQNSFGWIRGNIGDWHGDPTQFVLCGHSVGAFLVAKILEREGTDEVVDKAVLLSGLYDLEPMSRSYLNQDLKLSDQDCKALSPMYSTLQRNLGIFIAVGEQETSQFIEQSQKYCLKLKDDGMSPDLLVVPRANHYTIARMLAGQKNPIVEWIKRDVQS